MVLLSYEAALHGSHTDRDTGIDMLTLQMVNI
jgi:hypothetical protein